MTDGYWLNEGGENRLTTREDLRERAARGELDPRTPVWREGMADWRPLGELEEFRDWLPDPAPSGDQAGVGSSSPGVGSLADQLLDPPPRPWTRYGARLIDQYLGLIWTAVILFTLAPNWELPWAVAGMASLLLWAFAEAGFLSAMGTTPGKWILATHITDASGRRPSLPTALRRSLAVWLFGCGAGIPLLALFTYLRGYVVLQRDKVAPWDEAAGLRVRHGPVGAARIVGALVLIPVSAAAAFGLLMALYPWQDQARSALVELRQRLEETAKLDDVALAALSEIAFGRLGSGEQMAHDLELRPDEPVVVLAACDSTCLDLDLELLAPDGLPVALDDAWDAEPLLEVRPETGGVHTLIVSMPNCLGLSCAYSYQVLSASSLPRLREQVQEGTCFAVSPDGLLLTAAHVVEGAAYIAVFMPGQEAVAARVLELDTEHDLALLETEAPVSGWLDLAGPEELRLGLPVFTLGFPLSDYLGKGAKYTEGSVTALTGHGDLDTLVQVSIPIQPGNSGGPVVNDRGRVVGVVVETARAGAFLRSTGFVPQNVNWAVKASLARSLVGAQDSRPPASGREEAIERVRSAVCHIYSSSRVAGAH